MLELRMEEFDHFSMKMKGYTLVFSQKNQLFSSINSLYNNYAGVESERI